MFHCVVIPISTLEELLEELLEPEATASLEAYRAQTLSRERQQRNLAYAQRISRYHSRAWLRRQNRPDRYCICCNSNFQRGEQFIEYSLCSDNVCREIHPLGVTGAVVSPAEHQAHQVWLLEHSTQLLARSEDNTDSSQQRQPQFEAGQLHQGRQEHPEHSFGYEEGTERTACDSGSIENFSVHSE